MFKKFQLKTPLKTPKKPMSGDKACETCLISLYKLQLPLNLNQIQMILDHKIMFQKALQ